MSLVVNNRKGQPASACLNHKFPSRFDFFNIFKFELCMTLYINITGVQADVAAGSRRRSNLKHSPLFDSGREPLLELIRIVRKKIAASPCRRCIFLPRDRIQRVRPR